MTIKMKGNSVMKQPTITVVLIASENRFTNQKEVKMDALVRVKNPAFQNAGYGIMEVSARHNPKYSTAQYLCMLYGKPLNLENKSVKVTLENLPCEYIKGKRQDGSEYYAVLVNLNGKKDEDAMMRIFYLDEQQIRSIKDFKSEFEFVESTEELPQEEDDESEQEE